MKTMPYIIGVDVGGTFTDVVVLDAEGSITIGKALSTPRDFSTGVLDSIESAAEAMGIRLEELFGQANMLLLGTTAAENAIITGQLARVGLLMTKGFEDILILARGGYGRWSGLSDEEIRHPVMTNKPPPIVSAAVPEPSLLPVRTEDTVNRLDPSTSVSLFNTFPVATPFCSLKKSL